MGAVSSLSEAAAGNVRPRRRFRVNLPDPGRQPVVERPACLRQKVWASLLGLPRVVARLEQLRAEVQRQWLSVDERARFSHLAEPRLLASDFPHYPDLAPREQP